MNRFIALIAGAGALVAVAPAFAQETAVAPGYNQGPPANFSPA